MSDVSRNASPGRAINNKTWYLTRQIFKICFYSLFCVFLILFKYLILYCTVLLGELIRVTVLYIFSLKKLNLKR